MNPATEDNRLLAKMLDQARSDLQQQAKEFAGMLVLNARQTARIQELERQLKQVTDELDAHENEMFTAIINNRKRVRRIIDEAVDDNKEEEEGRDQEDDNDDDEEGREFIVVSSGDEDEIDHCCDHEK